MHRILYIILAFRLFSIQANRKPDIFRINSKKQLAVSRVYFDCGSEFEFSGRHENFLYFGIGEGGAPQTPLLPSGGSEAPPDIPPRGQGVPDPLCAQARSDRTAREHEVLIAWNVMSNHIDMQEKYCGHSNVIHPIQSQYTKIAAVGRNHKIGGAAFGRATSLWFPLYWL